MSHAGLLLTRPLGHELDPREAASDEVPAKNERQRERQRELTRCGAPEGYDAFFACWTDALNEQPGVRSAIATATSRTLIGHGLMGALQVGMALHHTYGVPFLPGSALKGLLAHHVHRELGHLPAWRAPTLGNGGEVVEAPGEYFAAMFGAAGTGADSEEGGSEGAVEFHDALLDPESIPKGSGFLVGDVLTPHQLEYYRDASRDPNDYTDPKPVAFVTARPGLRYQLFLSGDAAWCRLAMQLLRHALEDAGLGAKTTAGYGRFEVSIVKTADEEAAEEEARLAREADGVLSELVKLLGGVRGLGEVSRAYALTEQLEAHWKADRISIDAIFRELEKAPQGYVGPALQKATELHAEYARARAPRSAEVGPSKGKEKAMRRAPCRVWLAPKKGDVFIETEGPDGWNKQVAATQIAFDGGKLRDGEFRAEIPQHRPEQCNFVVSWEGKQKKLEVTKP